MVTGHFILLSCAILLVRGIPTNYDDNAYRQDVLRLLKEWDTTQGLRQQAGWPADTVKVGQVGGVAVDQDGSVMVFHRADRVWDSKSFDEDTNNMNSPGKPIPVDTILRIDPDSGDQISSFGSNKFYYPHGVTVDKDGAVYVTDVGLHQVLRFPKGADEPDLVLGEEKVSGRDDDHFCKPTDVAVLSNGDFFVSDGYCNGRIMKFSKNGTLMNEFGSIGKDIGQFHVPHSLSMIQDTDVLCVADRENSRIQCFDAGTKDPSSIGRPIQSFDNNGKVYAIAYDVENDVMYLVNQRGQGLTMAYDGDIEDDWGPSEGRFRNPHDVAVNPAGTAVFVGEIGAKPRITKFVRNN